MATHTDTNKLKGYQSGNFPSLGNPDLFISNELGKIQLAIDNIISVMKLLEQRMNTNGLT